MAIITIMVILSMKRQSVLVKLLIRSWSGEEKSS